MRCNGYARPQNGFGSFASIFASPGKVCFTPDNDQKADVLGCPQSAMSRSRGTAAAPGATGHSALMFASLMTFPHLSISDLKNEASSSGVEQMTTAPPCSSLSLTVGAARAATVSACIWLM